MCRPGPRLFAIPEGFEGDSSGTRDAVAGVMSESRPLRVPRAGDIVIYRRATGVCLLSAFQHASELTFHTYDDAVREAKTLADEHHVDAWYTVDGETYQNMAHHRRDDKPVQADS